MKITLITLAFLIPLQLTAQSCDDIYIQELKENIIAVADEIGYQGVRILSYSDGGKKCSFLVGVASTNSAAGKSESILDRITSVKLKREVLLFINGSNVASETIFETEQVVTNDDVSYYESIIDKISENSSGFVQGMKSLRSFRAQNGNLYVNTQYNLIQE